MQLYIWYYCLSGGYSFQSSRNLSYCLSGGYSFQSSKNLSIFLKLNFTMDAITYSCCNKSYSMEVEGHWGLDSVIHLTQKSVAVVHARNTAQLSGSKMNAVARAQ